MNKNILLATTLALVMLGAMLPTANAQANPVLKATLSTYDPIPAQPGRLIDVWVSIQNLGDTEARDVTVTFVDSFPFRLASEADRITQIKSIGKQSSYLVKYSVNIDDSAPDGTNYINLKMEASNLASGSNVVNIPIDIKTSEIPATISSVALIPSTITPGSKADLTLTVRNLAKANTLRDMTVTLQLTPIVSATGILIDLPFVPVGGTTQQKLDTLGSGQSHDFLFEIASYPDAKAQLYKLPVTLSYKDDAGNVFNQTTLIGVEVNSVPEIIMNIESTDLNSGVKTGNIVFSVINKGISDIKLATLTLAKSPDYDLMSPSNIIYLGKVDSDDFQTAKFMIKANKETLSFPITIEYKDALNKNYKQDFTIDYQLKDGDGKTQGSSLPIVVVVIVVVVAAYLFFRRRSRKKKEEE